MNTLTRVEKYNELIQTIETNKHLKAMSGLAKTKSFFSNGGSIDEDGRICYSSDVGLVKDHIAFSEYMETDLFVCKLVIFGALEGTISNINGGFTHGKKEIKSFINWSSKDLIRSLEVLRDDPGLEYTTAIKILSSLHDSPTCKEQK